MIPVFSAKEMAELDRLTIEEFGLPGMVLMETAARGVFRTALEILQDAYSPSVPLPLSLGHNQDDCCGEQLRLPARLIAEGKFVKIFCGKGNNGGDGLAVARMLYSVGAEVEVLLLCKGEELAGDTRKNFDLAQELGMEIIEEADSEDFYIAEDCDLVIDALLGTGAKGPAQGKTALAIEEINDASCPVISIDLPSGVETSTGKALGPAVQASATPTMGALKRGLVFSPGRELAGEVSIVDIGIPNQLIEGSEPNLWRVEFDDIFARLPQRPSDTHKGECGRILIIAGSAGLTGAGCLTASACVKAGAGLVVVGVPLSLNPIFEMKLTEAMTLPLPDTPAGSLSESALPFIVQRLDWANACAIGPGLSRNSETLELARKIIASLKIPSVIDADALFALAEEPDSLRSLPPNCVLTPHIGEFARLTGKTPEEVKDERVELVRQYAQEWKAVIVLKGSPTLIASPEGQVYINSTGNSGMATGGVGDALSGIITALLGQGLSASDSAMVGVFIHGLAGDFACAELGTLGLSATDLIDKIPQAFRDFGC
jgi:NAD(P)H-hydrate epimerase